MSINVDFMFHKIVFLISHEGIHGDLMLEFEGFGVKYVGVGVDTLAMLGIDNICLSYRNVKEKSNTALLTKGLS